MKLHFLYATETGTTEMLCEDIIEELELDAKLDAMSDVMPGELQSDTFYILVASSHGSGDISATGRDFSEALDEDPDLTHVRFAIFGLGDMVFAETYNQGSERLMRNLVRCGARQIGPRGLHDASSPDLPEDIAIPWARDILAGLQEAAA